MENERYYQMLRQFLAASGLTVVQFAEKANIIPEILKESFDTTSKLMIGNFISVAIGCQKAIGEQNDARKKTELQRLYTRYFAEYLEECPNEFLSISNPHFIRRIEEMAALAGEEVSAKVRHLLHPEEEKLAAAKPNAALSLEEKDAFHTKLNELLALLNKDGQREILKRIEELTYVPAYQNREKS